MAARRNFALPGESEVLRMETCAPVTRPGHLLRAVLALALLGVLAAPIGAEAAQPSTIHNDCADDGKLSRNYSNADLRRARDSIPADLDEYSDCRDVIGSAIKGGASGSPGDGGGGGDSGAGGGSGSGSTPSAPLPSAPLPEDATELESITESAGDEPPPAVQIGSEAVEPGANGLFDLASAENHLPAPLVAALLALALITLAAGFLALRGRTPGSLARAAPEPDRISSCPPRETFIGR